MNALATLHQLLVYLSLVKERRVVVGLLKEVKRQLDWRRIAYLSGTIGITVIVLTTFAAALAFRGPNGNAYSMLNHKISTLGHLQFSNWATLFNWGLCTGGLCLMVFMVALGRYVNHYSMHFVTFAGLVMATGVVLVGIWPVTEPQGHKLAVQITFLSGLATTSLFTLVTVFGRFGNQRKLSKWLALPSGSVTLAFLLFLVTMYTKYDDPQRVFIEGPVGNERPYLWLPSLLEWLLFGVVITWILTTVLYLFLQEQAGSVHLRRIHKTQ